MYTRNRTSVLAFVIAVMTLLGVFTPASAIAATTGSTSISLADAVHNWAANKKWSSAQADTLLATLTNQVQSAAYAKGLSTVQTNALLSDVAKLGYATSTVTGSSVTTGTSSTFVAATNFGPARLHEWITYKNFLGMALATMDAKKQWWGDKICCVTVAPDGVFSIGISTLGAITGWDWHGFVYNDNFFYPYPGHNNSHAGHASEAQGLFSFCPPRVICLQKKHPTEWQHGHYDLKGTQGLTT